MYLNNLFLNRFFWLSLLAVIFIGISDTKGQSFQTAASWSLVEYGNRISALGQSSAVLDNRMAFSPNPAVPSENGILTFSSFLFASSPIQTLRGDKPVLYNPAISYGAGRWSFSGKLDYERWGSVVELRDEANNFLGERRLSSDTRIVRFNLSREIGNQFYLGLGISHINDQRQLELSYYYHIGEIGSANAGNALMFSAGLYYNDSFPVSWIILRPQFGLALTDIGGALNYDFNSQFLPERLQLTTPGQLRSNFGLDVVTRKIVAGQRFAKVGIYLGLNKYMSGLVQSDDGEKLYTGLSMITGTWGNIERYSGQFTTTYTLSDQISTSYGFEIGLLETLFFQLGRISGADMWIRPQRAFGVRLNLEFFSLSYNKFTRRQTEWEIFDDMTTAVWNIDLRVPVTGSLRPTVLNRLVKWLSE